MNPGPQLEDGFTRIANELLEAIYNAYFTVSESRVFWFVVRRTYGFGKRHDWIPERQFASAIHSMSRRNIAKTLRQLITRQIISIQRDGRGHPTYGVQKDYARWSLPSNKKARHPVRRRSIKPPSNEMHKCIQPEGENAIQPEGIIRKKDNFKESRNGDEPIEQQPDLTNAPILELTEEELKAIEANDELTYWKRKAGIDVSDEHDV